MIDRPPHGRIRMTGALKYQNVDEGGRPDRWTKSVRGGSACDISHVSESLEAEASLRRFRARTPRQSFI